MDSLAHKTQSYNTNMLLKVFFDKTVFLKFKISNHFERNIDETDLKQSKIHGENPYKKSQAKKSQTKSLKTFAKSL
jgi:hypothetical protein